jgi:hypothetical protein
MLGEIRFAADSPVEGAGFEPSVPRQESRRFGPPPSPAEAVVVVAEVMVPAEIAAQIARLRSPTADGALPSLRWKSNKTVSTSWSFTGDRWFESISLQR